MKEKELLYLLALQRVPKVGDVLAKRLLQHCGSAEDIFKSSARSLLTIEGIGTILVKSLRDTRHFKYAEEELAFIRAHGISCSAFTDAEYPSLLKHCIDSPLLLFSKGNIRLAQQHVISIVGTRNLTSQGRRFTEELIAALAPLNPIIVSGFAYGTDICAHRAAVQHGLQTIACLAHGLNQIYPRVHQKYVTQLEENGGFLTDFWSTDAFDRNNFLKRNRIIAGMSEATIVIESAEKGGSLVTADIAHSYNREVFAVPGRPKDAYSIGCLNLIKQQKAQLITSAADLIYQLDWELKGPKKKAIQPQLFVELTEEERRIRSYLQEESKALLDSIAISCDLSIPIVAATLFGLEMKGMVRPLPGKTFEWIQ